MPRGDVLDDREAQPGAAERAAAARIDAVEAFGKPGQMLGRDAVAPIDDRQRDVAGIAGLESHRDRGAGAPVFHRIADEVVEPLRHLREIADDRRYRVRAIDLQLRAASGIGTAKLADLGSRYRLEGMGRE